MAEWLKSPTSGRAHSFLSMESTKLYPKIEEFSFRVDVSHQSQGTWFLSIADLTIIKALIVLFHK